MKKIIIVSLFFILTLAMVTTVFATESFLEIESEDEFIHITDFSDYDMDTYDEFVETFFADQIEELEIFLEDEYEGTNFFSEIKIKGGKNHVHHWLLPNCHTPIKCKSCKATIEVYIVHNIKEKCEYGFVCVNKGCNYEVLFPPFISKLFRHKFLPATCILPETCSKCGETKGEPLGHIYNETTGLCERCSAGKTELSFNIANYAGQKFSPGMDFDTNSYVIYFGGSGEHTLYQYDNPNNQNALFAAGIITPEDAQSVLYSVAYQGNPNTAAYEVILNDIVTDYMTRNPESTRDEALQNVKITSIGYSLGSDNGYFFREYVKTEQEKAGLEIEKDNTQFIGLDGLSYMGYNDLYHKAQEAGGTIDDPNITFILSSNTGYPVQAKEFLTGATYIPGEASHGGLPTKNKNHIIELITGEPIKDGTINSSATGVPPAPEKPGSSGGSTGGGGGGGGGGDTTTSTTPPTGDDTTVTPPRQEYSYKFIYDNNKPILSKQTSYTSEQLSILENILEQHINLGGVKTRAGVVNTARFLAGLDKAIPFNTTDNYQGHYALKGLNSKWGLGYGLSAPGLIEWIKINSELEDSDIIINNSDEYKLVNYYSKLKPGDIIESMGYKMIQQEDGTRKLSDTPVQTHISIVIGIDDKKIYIIDAVRPKLVINEILIEHINTGYLNTSYARGSVDFVRPLNLPDGNNLTNMWDEDLVWYKK